MLRNTYLTKDGLKKFQVEFEELTKRRVGAVLELQRAREMGDLSENGAYKAARFEVSGIDRRLRRLHIIIRTAKVLEPSTSGNVGFGRTFTIDNGKSTMTFMLVGSLEADPAQKKISIDSPLGKAIYGKHEGDSFTLSTPQSSIQYKIVKIS